jgi:ATP-dependent RNA helicase DeaD
MTSKLFSELGLSSDLLKAIDKLGFEQASPIQAAAIPLLMQGRDIVGQSQTGSGKTAAFGIPMVEKVDAALRAAQALILCPTRELAAQVAEEIHKLAFFKRGIHALPIYGGQSYDRQFLGLKQGAQIVIGTPGRVMDHMRRGTLRLDALKMVILDEADEMLNMGFRDDIDAILKAAPATRQTVFFSATIPPPIRELIAKHARDPQTVKIEQKALTVPTVEQIYYEVDSRDKVELLTRLVDLHDFRLGIIFCNTKRMVDDLVDHLNAQGYSADRLHGDMSQAQRDRVMNKFRKSGLDFLVATDVAARGIDVDDVEVVFNFDLPYDVEDYVHRIGRTGRKGRTGRAISFAPGREVFQIRNIERYANVRIQRGRIPSATEVSDARAGVFLDKLRETLKSGEYRRYDHFVERLLGEGFASGDIVSALMHQLQGGEAPASKPAPRPGGGARPEGGDRPPYRTDRPDSRPDRDDRRPRGEDRAPVGAPAARPASSVRPAPSPRPASAARPAPLPRPASPPVRNWERVAPSVPPPARSAFKAPLPDAQPHVEPKSVMPDALATAPIPPAPAAPLAPKPATIAKVETAPAPRAEAPPAPHTEPAPAPKSPPVQMAVSVSGVAPIPVSGAKPVKLSKPVIARPLPPPVAKTKPAASRRTPGHQTRLWMSVGEEHGVVPIDIVNSIAGETGLPGKVVGTVDIRERHLFVDVDSESANSIITKLNRAEIKGQKIKVKLA